LIGVWAAPYYKQTFPDSVSEYAVVNALITGAVGMSSGILGGYIADRLGTWFEETTAREGESTTSIIRDYFDQQTIRLLLPIFGSLLAIPAWYLTTHTTSSTNAFEIAMTWLAIGRYHNADLMTMCTVRKSGSSESDQFDFAHSRRVPRG
jgi:hypothetical protein